MQAPLNRNTLLSQYKLEITELEKRSASRSLWLYFQVYLAIGIAIIFGSILMNPLAIVVVMIFIAGRQHSLYILSHDASHYSLFKSKKLNKIIATIFSNLVMFHHPEAWSFVQWRRVHLKHHSHLFTQNDPNYVGRQRAGDTERTYTCSSLWRACLLAIPQNFLHFFIGKEDYVCSTTNKVYKSKVNHLAALFIPFTKDKEMEWERRINLLFFTTALVTITYLNLWKYFLLFWVLPMYLFYPMILKYHDLTEHFWETKSADLLLNTRSEKRNLFVKLIFSYLPRNYHREHHFFPRVAVVRLPALNRLFLSEKCTDQGVLDK